MTMEFRIAGLSCGRSGVVSPSDEPEQGSILLVTLILMSCVLAAGVGLLTLSSSDRAMAANYRRSVVTAYGAQAAAAYVAESLAHSTNWDASLAAGAVSTFADPSTAVITPWGERADISAETHLLQQATNSQWQRGADTPVWRLFAWGPVSALVGGSASGETPYVMAWVCDNPADGDADPTIDADGILVVRAEARLRSLKTSVLVFLRREAMDNSVMTGSVAGGAGPATSPDATSGGLAQILPPGGDSGSATAMRVRILSWREVP